MQTSIFLIELLPRHEPRTIVRESVVKVRLALLYDRVTFCLFGCRTFLGVGCCLPFGFLCGFLIVGIYLVPELRVCRPRVF